jgi:uncharacterized repeat protein (TIGR01451 family)
MMTTFQEDHVSCTRLAVPQRRWFVILAALVVGMALAYAVLHTASASAATPRQEGFPPGQGEAEAAITSDIQVQSFVSSEEIRPGDTLTFTLRYTNSLAIPVANIQIKDTLSKGQIFYGTYESAPLISTDQFTYTGAETTGYALQWELPTLDAHSTGEIVFTTQVLTDSEPNIDDPIILLGNAVEIQSTSDPVSGNASDSVVMVTGPLLSLSKAASSGTILPGHILTYTITVENNTRLDAIAAIGMKVIEHIPNHTTFYWASSPGTFDSVTGDVTWNLGSPLNPGDSIDLQFSVLVTDDIGSVHTIVNRKIDYRVRAAENLFDVTGDNIVNVVVAPVLLKTVQDRNGGAVDVYPTEEVTYTISVLNPISQSLSGVILTDTLPGNPLPFVYLRMADSNPPPQVSSDGRNLSWTLDLASWGSASRAFVARVPQNICIPNNKTFITLRNALAATHPDTYFRPEASLAPVKVEAPLILQKNVEPNHGMRGDIVTYTVSLVNRGPFLVSNIRITDTLEGNFHFLNMVAGPPPLPEYSYGVVVWSGLSVPAGQTIDLVFNAVVDGHWLIRYYNNLSATSPDACIPSLTNKAPVLVDPPLAINKTAAPDSVFLKDILEYSLEVSNVSDVAWTLDKIEDTLPPGFIQVGGSGTNLALIDFDPPEVIGPFGSWMGSFSAMVDTADCSKLPKTYPNAKSAIWVYTLAPEAVIAVNSTNLAPVTVNPNIVVSLSTNRGEVQIGDTLTYTLRLNNISPTSATGSTLTFNLPMEFEYLATLQGPPPTSVNGTQLVWQNALIPANTEVVVVFTARVLPGTSYGDKSSSFSGSAADICFGKMNGGVVSVVKVLEYAIELTKKALKTQLPPLTLIDYTIDIKNLDKFNDILLDAVTDTLPTGFIYHSMAAGPDPNVVQDGKVVWQNVIVSVVSETLTWKVTLQSSPLYGSNYTNQVWATSPQTRIITATSEPVSVLPLFDLQKIAGIQSTSAGGVVPYTITLVNLSQVAYSSIIVTDTLPLGFTFYRMHTGYLSPVTIGPAGSQPVWNIPSLGTGCGSSGCMIRLVFDVVIGSNVAPGVYLNQVIGDSPSGSVPGPIFTAPISVIDNGYLLTVDKAGSGSGAITSIPPGIDCGTDCQEAFSYGTVVTLTAQAAAESTFTGWSGACTGAGECIVTADDAKSVTATFTLNSYLLTVGKAGAGNGTVTSNPAGINCGADCQEFFSYGTVVTLTAQAAAGWTFAGWSGDCTGGGQCVLTMNQAKSVTATFTLNSYLLTVTKDGTGSGTVTSVPPGINCGADCQELFSNGTVVTLTAQAAAGSTFTGWSGSCTGTGQCVVTIDNAKSATATFTKIEYKIYIPLIRKTGSAGTLPTGERLDSPVAFSTSPVYNLTRLIKHLPLLLWTFFHTGGAA